jgi:dTDP-4-amino-4,6-dideoxygalactose transaminase
LIQTRYSSGKQAEISMTETLAIFGGSKVRQNPFPSRMQFESAARAAVNDVFDYYAARGQDFEAQGHFEQLYTTAFCSYLGEPNGYCDAVCSGTAALYVALAALELPRKSCVLVSPITDAGCLSAVILNDLAPKLVDVEDKSYLISRSTLLKRLDDGVSAVLLVHAAGQAVPDIAEVANLCRERGIALIEDCSQAHGALANRKRVGTFGDISVFSTMHKKTHASGSNGGLIFTRSKELYQKVRMFSDRGKAFHETGFDAKNPATFRLPALNLPQDELSCAIGSVTLQTLDSVRAKRISLIEHLNKRLAKESCSCQGLRVSPEDSPFFWPILFDETGLSCDKRAFTSALLAEGLPINPHYGYLVSDWPWVRPHLFDKFLPQAAVRMIDRSFNLLFHEGFSLADIDDVVAAILKVERFYQSR